LVGGCAVYATLHQPRSSIFALLDGLHLLAEGRVVYAGPAAVWIPNLQPDFNVSLFDVFDARISAVLRELHESNRFVQKAAESTLI